jgi:DNA mismatch repair protein MutS
MSENLTPLFQQYWRIKQQYPDVLLLFRLGDFYELFADDAVTAAAALNITLTSRDAARGERISMCGVPYHSADRYIARLIAAGFRVAVCDQMEDARTAKQGLIRRKVTRVITPGTVLEDSMLEAKANNYLAAVATPERDDAGFGLAVCDVSTGEFLATEVQGQDARQRLDEELARLAPAELLLSEEAAREEGWADLCQPWTVSPIPATGPRRAARETLLRHFGVSSLRGFGCEEMPRAIEAAAMLLGYLQLRHIDTLQHVRSLGTYSTTDYMGLDRTARRNLEITQALGDGGRARSLLSILDATRTPMGSRLMRRWLEQPLLDPERIRNRHDAVEPLSAHALLRGDLREHLGGVADLERLASRAGTGIANPKDLVRLRDSLGRIPVLRDCLSGASATLLTDLADRLEPLEDIDQLLASALVDDPPLSIREGGLVREGFSAELDRLKQSRADGKEWIANLELTEKERTGIKSLKVGYNQVFGYFIEVTKPNVPYAPSDYIRKQTTSNAERYITQELQEREKIILRAEEEINSLEARLFADVRQQVGGNAGRILGVARAVAELDTLSALAEVAVRYGYARPTVGTDERIEIRNGRHPMVERLADEPFVPNDALLDSGENRILIITGPNMAGKSTFLRQVALIALMAQAGSFVPADQAHLGVLDRIYTRVGAQDDLSAGQSTFMVEMSETASILNNATERSLVLLDEIGRGTSTYDGLSIAWAVVEFLQQVGARTLFATHYHHLNDLAERLPGVRNFRAAVKEDGHHVVWLRKIIPGGTDKSYGIQVARLAGLPERVVHRAQEVLAELESDTGNGGRVQPAGSVRVSERQAKIQMTLFEAEEHPAIEELRRLDLSVITPVEALTALYHLQKKVS